MSRMTADHRPANKGLGHGQEDLWAEIRRQQAFTVQDLEAVVDMSASSVRAYVARLVAGGYLDKVPSSGPFSPARYRLVRDGGVHAPRLRADGSPVSGGSGVRNMWRSMRMLGTFTPAELAAHSTTETVQVSGETARAYAQALCKAGYLRVLEKAIPRRRQARYKLVRDTGPRPPQIQRVKVVYDQNVGRVMTPEDRG